MGASAGRRFGIVLRRHTILYKLKYVDISKRDFVLSHGLQRHMDSFCDNASVFVNSIHRVR